MEVGSPATVMGLGRSPDTVTARKIDLCSPLITDVKIGNIIGPETPEFG